MLDDNQKKYILKNYLIKTNKQIINDLKISRSEFYNFLNKTEITKSKKGKRWTEQENNFLKENYNKLSYKEIGLKIGRSEDACEQQARKIGLKNKTNDLYWSKEEIEILKTQIKTSSYNQIQKLLPKRNLQAIYNKVYELNLVPPEVKGYKKLKQEQIWFILENCQRMTDEELGKKFNVSAQVIKGVRKKNGIIKESSSCHKITYIEQFVIDELKENNIDFDFNKPLGKYVPDFQFPNSSIIIEVNGDYFHCNPEIYGDGPKDENQIKHIIRDYYKKCFYAKENKIVYYIWENEILKNPQNVKEKIKKIVSAVQEQRCESS